MHGLSTLPTTPRSLLPEPVAVAQANGNVAVAVAGGVWYWTDGVEAGAAPRRAEAWLMAMADIVRQIAVSSLTSLPPDEVDDAISQVRMWLFAKLDQHPADAPLTVKYCRTFIDWRVKQFRRRIVRMSGREIPLPGTGRSPNYASSPAEDRFMFRASPAFEVDVETSVDRAAAVPLDELLSALPDDDRRLRDIARMVAVGTPYEEIGAAIGVAKGTISKRLRGPVRQMILAAFSGRLDVPLGDVA